MQLRRYSRYIKLIFLFWDIILLNTTYLTSYYFRYGNLDRLLLRDGQTIWLITNIVWFLLITIYDSYKFIRVEPIEKTLIASLKLTFKHIIILFTCIVVLKYQDISRLRIIYFYSLFAISIAIFRIIFIKCLKHIRKKGFNFRNVIIIGADKNASEIYHFLSKDLSYGYRVLGFFDDKKEESLYKDKIIGTLDDVKEFTVENGIHEIYFTLPDFNDSKVREIIEFCESNLIRIKFIPDYRNLKRNKNICIDFYSNIPVLSLRKEPLEEPINRIIKRSFDIIFASSVILLIFPWLFPLIIILIKTSSKGPIFFKQNRSGEDNKTFTCWKFRSMRVNNNADIIQATKNDTRITRTGKFLRKSNLDELPQFFNVMWGDMSIVGPRPHMLKHTEEYSNLINNYLVRHFAKPGITGWAQVNGLRGETKELEQMENRVAFDIWYIENWSFLLDLKIVYMTIWNMFKGEENAG